MQEVIQGKCNSIKIDLYGAKSRCGPFTRLTGEFECTSVLVGILSQVLVLTEKRSDKNKKDIRIG